MVYHKRIKNYRTMKVVRIEKESHISKREFGNSNNNDLTNGIIEVGTPKLMSKHSTNSFVINRNGVYGLSNHRASIKSYSTIKCNLVRFLRANPEYMINIRKEQQIRKNVIEICEQMSNAIETVFYGGSGSYSSCSAPWWYVCANAILTEALQQRTYGAVLHCVERHIHSLPLHGKYRPDSNWRTSATKEDKLSVLFCMLWLNQKNVSEQPRIVMKEILQIVLQKVRRAYI